MSFQVILEEIVIFMDFFLNPLSIFHSSLVVICGYHLSSSKEQ